MSDLPDTFPTADDPRNSASYRAAKALAISLGVLMVLAFIAVVVVLVTRFKSGNSAAASSQGPQITQLPTGAKITDMKVDSGHLILRIKTDQGEEIRIVDDASGNVVSRIVVPK